MKPAAYTADHLRTVLKTGGSAPHTEEVQRFFKHEVVTRGWYTAELRKLARRFTKVLKNEAGLPYLVEVADLLFDGEVLEEKALAVFLLEKDVDQFGIVSSASSSAGLAASIPGPITMPWCITSSARCWWVTTSASSAPCTGPNHAIVGTGERPR